MRAKAAAVVVLLADQPALPVQLINQVIERFYMQAFEGKNISRFVASSKETEGPCCFGVAPTFEVIPRPPVFFQELFSQCLRNWKETRVPGSY